MKHCFYISDIILKTSFNNALNCIKWASLVAQTVKNLPAVQEAPVQSQSQEGTLENGMATHYSILFWRISWREETGRLQSRVSHRVRHNWENNTHLQCIKGLNHLKKKKIYIYIYILKYSFFKNLILKMEWIHKIINNSNRRHYFQHQNF